LGEYLIAEVDATYLFDRYKLCIRSLLVTPSGLVDN
jgi:hypothetical protein